MRSSLSSTIGPGCLSAEEGDWGGGREAGACNYRFHNGVLARGPPQGELLCSWTRGEGRGARQGLAWGGARPGRWTFTVHSCWDHCLCTHYVSGAGMNPGTQQ